MKFNSSLTGQVIAKAEAMGDGVCVGIAHLADVLRGPSYRAVQDDPGQMAIFGEDVPVEWPINAQTVLVMGLLHPPGDPRLDWWERGDTLGNRYLRRRLKSLQRWLHKEHGLNALPLPYNVAKGGLFLKDAAVLSGLGIVGRNNLVIHPQWGPRVRWRALLIKEALTPTASLLEFSPCESCDGFCHQACPVAAFSKGSYIRINCTRQMSMDEARRDAEGRYDIHGRFHAVIKYCRACELSCPIGA